MNDLDLLENSKDKLKKICEVIRSETLEPSKKEAEDIRQQAKEEGLRIVEASKREAETIIQLAHQEIERERKLFETALSQAAKQAILALKNEIESKLLTTELEKWIIEATSNPELAKKLIEVLIAAIEKEGMETDLSIAIGKSMNAAEINRHLASRIRERLREKGVLIGNFEGGIRLSLHKEHLTFDLSDEAIRELLLKYLKGDFQRYLLEKSNG